MLTRKPYCSFCHLAENYIRTRVVYVVKVLVKVSLTTCFENTYREAIRSENFKRHIGLVRLIAFITFNPIKKKDSRDLGREQKTS